MDAIKHQALLSYCQYVLSKINLVILITFCSIGTRAFGFEHYIHLHRHCCSRVLKMSQPFLFYHRAGNKGHRAHVSLTPHLMEQSWKVHLRAHLGPGRDFSISRQKIRKFQLVRVWEMSLSTLENRFFFSFFYCKAQLSTTQADICNNACKFISSTLDPCVNCSTFSMLWEVRCCIKSIRVTWSLANPLLSKQ